MASAIVVAPRDPASTLSGRFASTFDRYSLRESSHENFQPSHEADIPISTRSRRQSIRIMDTPDQDSPEVTGHNEDGSMVSSSEVKAQRSTERRTRAKKGSMRDYSTESDEEFEGTTRRRRERRSLADSKYKRNLSDFHFERPDPVTAAKNKANRERQRRERLNDSFADLVKTLDPEGSIKGEKTSIIAGTIRSINALRKENTKLKQEKSEMQQKMTRIEEEKRETEFQRELVERQLDDLRLNVYGPRVLQNTMHGRPDAAGQVDASPSPSGLSRMLQEQASLQDAARQGSVNALDTQMFQPSGPPQQAGGNAFMPSIPGQSLDQPMTQQPGSSVDLHPTFNPGADFLDILGTDITPDGMSMSPIVWLNEALGPEADESYMCSNL